VSFDPEKVERYGDEDEMEHPIRCVNERDYDQLLALYHEVILRESELRIGNMPTGVIEQG
jgi:hypothetical protein